MKTNWISVKKEVPDYEETVLVINVKNDHPQVWIGKRTSTNKYGHHWHIVGGGSNLTAITHWVPLPEPPEDFKTTNNKTTEL